MNKFGRITWEAKKDMSICGRIFGATTTSCIAKDLGIYFDIAWECPPFLQDVLGIVRPCGGGKHDPYYNFRLNKTDEELMEFFEDVDNTKRLLTQHITISTEHNMYQHFCFNRKYNYKHNLLQTFIRVFHNMFRVKESVLIGLPKNLGRYVGIHIPIGKEDEKKYIPYIRETLEMCNESIMARNEGAEIFLSSNSDMVFEIAKMEYSHWMIMHNTSRENECKRVIQDVICISRCKSVYMCWNSSFSRLGCVLAPFRRFYCYNHPSYFHGMREVEIDEIVSYYKN